MGSRNSCSWRTNEAKKAPAKTLSTAARPRLAHCPPAHGTEPLSKVFIPASGPGQAPGHTNLGDAVNDPPVWSHPRAVLPQPGPVGRTHFWALRLLPGTVKSVTHGGAGLGACTQHGTRVLAHATLSLPSCNTPGWRALTPPPTQTAGSELPGPLP